MRTFPTGPKDADPPTVSIVPLSTIDESGYNWNMYRLDSHAGTHVDAPLHFARKGKSVDEVRLSDLVGPALVIDVREHGGYDFSKVRRFKSRIKGKIVLLCTGWARNFGKANFFIDFPEVPLTIAEFIVEFGGKSLGVETPGPESLKGSFPSHTYLLGHGIPIIENLNNLSKLVGHDNIIFVGAPLMFQGGDASPIRAFAIVGRERRRRQS